MTDAVHREAMVRLAIAGEPRFDARPPSNSTARAPATRWTPCVNCRPREPGRTAGSWSSARTSTPACTPGRLARTAAARGAGGGQPPGRAGGARPDVRAARRTRWCRCRCWTSRHRYPPPRGGGEMTSGIWCRPQVARYIDRTGAVRSLHPKNGRARELNGHPQAATGHRRWPGRT